MGNPQERASTQTEGRQRDCMACVSWQGRVRWGLRLDRISSALPSSVHFLFPSPASTAKYYRTTGLLYFFWCIVLDVFSCCATVSVSLYSICTNWCTCLPLCGVNDCVPAQPVRGPMSLCCPSRMRVILSSSVWLAALYFLPRLFRKKNGSPGLLDLQFRQHPSASWARCKNALLRVCFFAAFALGASQPGCSRSNCPPPPPRILPLCRLAGTPAVWLGMLQVLLFRLLHEETETFLSEHKQGADSSGGFAVHFLEPTDNQ